MYFVGLDLAWSYANQTGIAVIDHDGRLVRVDAAITDEEIINSIEPYVRGDCLVAIDAPLVVTNPAGYRAAETLLNRDFARFEAPAQPANTRNRLFNPPRGEVLANTLDLDVDPQSTSSRRAIEVYPHPATISLFRLGRTLKYKRRNPDAVSRKSELLRLVAYIEGLDAADPRLRLDGCRDWTELQAKATAASRPFQLNACEDPIDAVLCAYIALYVHRRRSDAVIYGDATGYIVTPKLPPDLVPSTRKRASASPPKDADDVAQRLARAEAWIRTRVDK